MKKLYNVLRVIDKQGMANFGKVIQLNQSPMPHNEACAFLKAHTKHSWCRDYLKETI